MHSRLLSSDGYFALTERPKTVLEWRFVGGLSHLLPDPAARASLQRHHSTEDQ
jgi:hypothetical protein